MEDALPLSAVEPPVPRGRCPRPQQLSSLRIQSPDLGCHGLAKGRHAAEANGRHDSEPVTLAQAPHNGPGVWRVGHWRGLPEEGAVSHAEGSDCAWSYIVAGSLHCVCHAVGPELQTAIRVGLLECLRLDAGLPELRAIKAQMIRTACGVLEEEGLAIVVDDRVEVPNQMLRSVVPEELTSACVEPHGSASSTTRGFVGLRNDNPVVRSHRSNVLADGGTVAIRVHLVLRRGLPGASLC
mmetsp:Transcript_27783/g.64780  ORF Transcript_27783/g.64780 Transcript_27783/m.64780 type:complete len:239 (-) Transcript_27783:537-1253(-)